MSPLDLSTPGEGLMETHVTWEDVEEQIRRERGVDVRFGDQRSVVNIGDGSGFLSRIGVVDADWQGDSNVIPNRFVIKIATCLGGKEIGHKLKELKASDGEKAVTEETENNDMRKNFELVSRALHNCEVTTYSLLNKYSTGGQMNMMNIHFSKKYEDLSSIRGFIGMDYADNVYLRHVYHNVKPDEIKDALRTLARLQACGRRFTGEERSQLPSRIRSMYGVFMKKDIIEMSLLALASYGGESLKEKAGKLSGYAEELVDTSLVDTLNKTLGMEDVFIHGDLWSANLMWKQRDDGLKLTRIIDYQLSHFGCPAEDLVRLFISTLSGQDRRSHWESLLEDFYSYLLEELEGETMPYSLEQLKESYLRMFPVASILLLVIIGPLAEVGAKNCSDEERTELQRVMAEKVEALYDDILELYQRNRKISED